MNPLCPIILVYDKQTGALADASQLALEDWAHDLIYSDIEGWALEEDGTLILCDECGSFAYPPPERFEVYFNFPKLVKM